MKSTITKYLRRGAGYAMAALIVAVMGSCIREGRHTDDTDTADSGEAYISLTINTRSTPGGQEDPGTYDERRVGAVRMVLYSTDLDESVATAADYVAVRVFDFLIKSKDHPGDETTLAGYEEWNENWYPDEFEQSGYGQGRHLYSSDDANDMFVTWARPVPRRDYKMLILLNIDEYIDTPPAYYVQAPSTRAVRNLDIKTITSAGRTLAEFLDEAVLDDSYQYRQIYLTQYGFVMTNSMGLVDVPASLLQPDEDLSNQNPIPVRVDRICAKIIVDAGDTSYWYIPDGATISNMYWGLNNTNKKFYWMRKQTEVIGYGMHERDMYPDFYYNPPNGDSWRASIYAEDPNFSGITGDPALVNENFGSYGKYDYVQFRNRPSAEVYDYVLENTMAGDEQYDDVITSVVVSLYYAPQGFSIGEAYFTYNGYAVSVDDALDYYWGRATVPADLDGIVEAMQAASEVIVERVEGYFEPLIIIENSYISVSSGFDVQGLRFYYSGICYYSIPIHHVKSYYGGEFAYGNYGVVRNNLYNITISGITGPGSPSVGGAAYMSAKITVLDWAGHTTIVDAGDPVTPI